MAKSTGLLVKVHGDGRKFRAAAAMAFGTSQVEPILHIPKPSGEDAKGFAGPEGATWLRIGVRDQASAWDEAHALVSPGHGFSAAASEVEAIEPDFEQSWPHVRGGPDPGGMAADQAEFCAFDDQDGSGGKATEAGVAWNFGDNFSELRAARGKVLEKQNKITIAHLDTGYDDAHVTCPENLDKSRQRNFVKDDNSPNDATDRTPPGKQFIRNRGHGTGTLSLLAGNLLDNPLGWPGYKDYVGGAPLAQIIPVRIADWVVRFNTGTMVQGFDWARSQGAHVLSMSMGGLASRALTDAVNLAYESGLVMVTAAGNNFAGVPMPKSIVFPARLNRVLAACGVMADGRAYAGLDFKTMQGNYGPASKMETALGAYTPNVPWAQIGCGNIVDMDGAGTSAATPQIAAAAALYLAEHWDVLSQYEDPWMRVAAVHRALFTSALKSTGKMNDKETRKKIGQGVLRADAALGVKPPAEADLVKLPPAKSTWPWLDLLFGKDIGVAIGQLSPRRRAMLDLELTQLAQRNPTVEEAIGDPDLPAGDIAEDEQKRYLEAVLDSGEASAALRSLLENRLARRPRTAAPASSATSTIRRKPTTLPTPSRRRLRVFALDPSIGKRHESISVNQTMLAVPWEAELQPGPVGEYLEVVDIDPASDRIYDPVDLNLQGVLAQDGWAPSEGNPQFHQQMVYAVGMAVIGHFERALGRTALWAPRLPDGKVGYQEVPRLRIYPHALRANNAYYSPDKRALLFGYFPADSREGDITAPGTMVFTCLSSDIVAHEMSHALLDGLHRRFQEASNPDVPAFHEGFADIVALFQHFTVTELVRFEIGRTRADLAAAELLGGLARQFGEGTSRGGPLRNYESKLDLKYADTLEPHDRGSIQVFAVYEAFRKIVARRTDDLVRLATQGTGNLPAGALHPDLIERLTKETCKTADHVLRMCIRALDYCPPVDLTFGEYLRAIITSDRDLFDEDPYGYRVAFMEAFRHRGILPTDVRIISEESLAWGTMHPSEWQPPGGDEAKFAERAVVERLLAPLDLGLNCARSRAESAKCSESNRGALRDMLEQLFAEAPHLYRLFGLVPDLERYNPDFTFRSQPKPGKSTFDVSSVRTARRVAPDGSFRTEVVATITQRRPVRIDPDDPSSSWTWFRGGATLILDPRKGHESLRYMIIKNIESETRLKRQRETAARGFLSPLRKLYFGDFAAMEPFAMLHADAGEHAHG